MTNNEAIGILAIVVETAKGRCFVTDEAISDAYAMAISALQEQEELYVYSQCKTCRYYHDDDDVRCMICDDENDMYEGQEAKTQLSAEGTTSDLISRQDAIEVIEEMQMPIMRSMFPEEQFVFKGMSEALSAIKDLPSAHPEIQKRKEESAQNVPKEDLISRKEAIEAMGKAQWAKERLMELPSAQPETHEERTETHACDCISRKTAIDAVSDACFELRGVFGRCEDALKALPSAQPEIKPISYQDCANAMMMMWIDNVLTDGEYRRIMDKLNDHESRRENR